MSKKKKKFWFSNPDNWKWIIASILVPILVVFLTIEFTKTSPNLNEITGRIIEQDLPAKGVKIYLYDRAGKKAETVTDKHGAFTFKDVGSGNYYIDFSHKSGVGMIPIELNSMGNVINIPVRLEDLVEIRFLIPKGSNTAFFLDGREMALVDGNRFIGSSDGDVMSSTGNAFVTTIYLVPDVHTYAQYGVEFSGMNNNKTHDYKITETIDEVSRSFIGNEDVHLKGIRFIEGNISSNLENFSKFKSKSVKYVLIIELIGFRNEDLYAVLGFRKIDGMKHASSDENYSSNGGISLRKNFRTTRQVMPIKLEFEFPHSVFSPYNETFFDYLQVFDEEDNLLSEFKFHLNYFSKNNRELTLKWFQVFEQDERLAIVKALLAQNKISEARTRLYNSYSELSNESLFLLGYSYYLTDDWENAINNLRKSYAEDSTVTRVNEFLAKAYFSVGKYDSASLHQRVLILNSKSMPKSDLSSLYGTLSWYEIFSGRYNEAIIAAEMGLDLSPSKHWIKTNLAHGLLFSGKEPEATQIYMNNSEIMLGKQNWAEVIAEDFAQFQEAGIDHRNMGKILSQLEKH